MKTISLTRWPPTGRMFSVMGQDLFQVPDLCLLHQVPPFFPNAMRLRLLGLVLHAFRELESTTLELGGDEAKFMALVKAAAPICCVLGSAKMDELTRQVPGVWALRS